MKTATALAKKLYDNPEKNWLPELELINLHVIFRPLYKGYYQFETPNRIVSFVILAYDNDSPWIDPKKDRTQNKISIIEGIGGDPESRIFKEILDYENQDVQEVILKYLFSQTDARWQEIMSLLDFSSKMMLFCNRQTNDKFKTGSRLNDETKQHEDEFKFLDPTEIAKVNQEKGRLLIQAIEARKKADELLKALESDFQKVDHVTQSEFQFQFSDVKKFDITVWEHRVRRKKALGL